MTKEEIIAFVKKNPISIGCGALSLALAAGIYFRSDELPAAEDELAEKSTEAARLAANIQNAAQLKEQVEALTVADKEMETRLVTLEQLKNYGYFYKLESETGTKMTAINQSIVAPPKGAKTAFIPVPFTITVQGSFAQILDYLRRLESGARYCRVMGVTCSVTPTDRNTVTLALNLELLGLP